MAFNAFGLSFMGIHAVAWLIDWFSRLIRFGGKIR
jgi:hypothetical protein